MSKPTPNPDSKPSGSKFKNTAIAVILGFCSIVLIGGLFQLIAYIDAFEPDPTTPQRITPTPD